MTATAPSSARISSQEHALLNHAMRLEHNRVGRLALHIQLSRLNGQNRREQQIETAILHFEEMVSNVEGQLYRSAAGDIIFVCDDRRPEDLDGAVQRMRQMFSDDPLTQGSDDNPEDEFCTRYALEHDYQKFLALALKMVDGGDAQNQAQRQENDVAGDLAARPAALPPRDLTPAQLGKVEEALANLDLSAVMRQQPVCVVTAGHPPKMVFHEIYVAIDDLGQILLPGVTLGSDPWLFQRLTCSLDGRMLRQIVHDHAKTTKAISLNLNVATVLSADFRRFEQTIGQGVRGRLIIEFQHLDIIADMPSFLFARGYLRELGVKVCVDGLNYLTLPLVDRGKFGVDLLKMRWNDDLLDAMGKEAIIALKRAVRVADVGRIILCRCESPSALRKGQELGISLFQGRHIDTLLASSASA